MNDPKDNPVDFPNKDFANITPMNVIDAANCALAFVSDTGLLLKNNSEFRALLPNAIEGQPISKSLDSPIQLKNLTDCLGEKKKLFTVQIISYNNIITELTLKLLKKDSSEKNVYLVSVNSQSTSEYNALIQQLIDTIPDSIFVKDTNCVFLLANNWVAKAMGAKSPSELIGKTDFDYYPKELATNYFKSEMKIIKSGKPLLNKLEKVLINNERRWHSSTKIPFCAPDGQIMGIMGISRDVTQQVLETKTVKKALHKAEVADKLKSSFLANLSHEIRTPLNGIIGFSQFLKQKTHSAEKQHKYLDIIHNNGNQLLRLINDILDISMIESKQISINKHQFRINALIDHLITNFDHEIKEQELNIKLKVVKGFPDEDDHFYSDESRLHQILGNLLDNAIKFTKKGSIELGYTIENSFIKFYMKDTGIGIHPKQQIEIFKRFRQVDESVTRKYGGTGLGLSICQGLVNKLGGEIWVESELKKGSKFIFTIPHDPINKKLY